MTAQHTRCILPSIGCVLLAAIGCTRTSPAPDSKAPVTIVDERAVRYDASLRAIDLRHFPMPPGSTVRRVTSHELDGSTPGSHIAVFEHCRDWLVENGWKADETDRPFTASKLMQDGVFEKAGFGLILSASAAADGTALVYFRNVGDVDCRTLPRLPDADRVKQPTTLDSRWYLKQQYTREKRDRIIEFVQTEMVKLGWVELETPREDHFGNWTIEFRKPGIALSVAVTAEWYEGDIAMRLVGYGVRLLENPQDVADIDPTRMRP